MKKEHKVKRIIHVSKKKEPKHVVNIKRIKDSDVEHIRKITVMNFNKFYDKYMKETTLAPDEYIDKMNRNIMMLNYHFKYDIYDTEEEKVNELKKMLEAFDYNTYIDIYVETSYNKLYRLGIYESMHNNIRKLYEVLHYLMIENSADIKLNQSLVDIRNTHFMGKRISTICSDRMIAMKDGVILDMGHNIKPSKEFKNSNILVEYRTNRFLNIPYLYYKRLSEIEFVEMDLTISLIPHEDFEGDSPYSDDNRMDLYHEKLSLSSIKDIIAKQMEIDSNVFGFSTIGYAEIATHVEYIDCTVAVYKKDRTVDEMSFDDFDSYYFQFLNW